MIILTYLILGQFLDTEAILVLAIPVVIHIAVWLDWALIWFGIIVTIALEMGMISAPVGISVFIVKSIAPDVPMRRMFARIWPFWFAMLAMTGLLYVIPDLALPLPRQVVG